LPYNTVKNSSSKDRAFFPKSKREFGAYDEHPAGSKVITEIVEPVSNDDDTDEMFDRADFYN